MAGLEFAFECLKKCISIEKDSVWHASKSDPIAALLLDLESSENNLPTCDPSCHCTLDDIRTKASTSSAQDANSQFFDARLRYGHKLIAVMQKVADELNELKKQDDSKSALVSVKHVSLLSSSFQFLILTCISPYLDKGVGVPLQLRSQVIRSWEKCAGDLEFRKNELTRTGECIVKLLNCNDAVRAELLRKYFSDIICVFEQLNDFGKNSLSAAYEELLSSAPPQLLMSTFLGLVKPRAATDKTPSWFTIAIGSHLSKILIGNDGLYITLSSYEELNGDGIWQNTHLLSVLGKQFALPPRNMKKMVYYKNITAQFFRLIYNEKFPREKLAQLFSFFVVDMKKRSALAASVLVEDELFRPWEVLTATAHPLWSSSCATSLCLLALWSDEKSGQGLLKNNLRYLQVAAMLLSLLPISSLDTAQCQRNLRNDVYSILKFALENVENLSEFLLAFIIGSSPCFQLTQDQCRVQEIGISPSVYGKVSLSSVQLNKEELLARKIDATISLLKSLNQPTASRLFIEVACKSVRMWDDGGEQQDMPRFINHGDPITCDTEFRRSSSHLIAGVFFEQLQDGDINFSDTEIILSLLGLVQATLQSTIRYISEHHEKMTLDIIAAPNEHDQQLRSTIAQNAKMAVGLAGAVIMAATIAEKTTSALSETCAELKSFSDCVYSFDCKDDAFLAMAEDARKLCSLFGLEATVPNPPAASPKKVRSMVDVIGEIREGLIDESPVTRGGALLQAGRLIQARNVDILMELDKWLFRALKDSIVDPDSYVYLAAINALAEAACYSSTFLRELITLFKTFRGSTESPCKENAEIDTTTADTATIVRSRLCEVLGKVFRVLGDLSPVWMDESAGVFLSCFSEKDEIIRTSALSSLAELILACRGKNIEKYLEEIFYAVEKMLIADPSSLVRRAAVHLLRQVIKSCDTALIEIVGDRLRDLHRELVRLWRWDSDHVVRLHAELALEELRVIMRAVITHETSFPRQIIL
ncbi:hypothetical protein V3C99_002971 [Haemonchus contortus]